MHATLTTSPAIVAEALVLMSVVKPILFVALFVAYMRFVAKFELDARRFTLPVLQLNIVFISVAAVGLAMAIFIPIFWISLVLVAGLFAGTMYGYWKFRDPRVPATAKYQLGGGKLAEVVAARRTASAERAASLQFFGPKGAKEPVPQKEDPALGVYLGLESLLAGPSESRASRVDLATSPQGTAVSMLVDGVRVKRDPMPLDLGNAVIDMAKRLAGLDPADRRRRQTGSFKMEGAGGRVEVQVTSIGSSSGQTVRIDFDRASRFGKPLDSLGFTPGQLETLRRYEDVGMRRGVIILSAPPGQGLTSLGYAMIGRHDAYTSNVKTLEREQQYRVEGVDHKVFEAEPGAEDYAAMLTKIIRRDPDVVLAADVSERGSAKAAALMGLEAPIVYVQIPAENLATAVAMWMQAVGDPKLASRCLAGAVHQRLLRTLCPNCKSGFAPSPEQAKRLGLAAGAAGAQLFRPSGKVQVKNRIEDCPVCQGTAYFGQTGIYEVMAFDDEARRLLSENDFRTAFARAVREQRMTQLQEAALLKVRSGDTSLEEVQRAFAPRQAPAPAGASSGGAAPAAKS